MTVFQKITSAILRYNYLPARTIILLAVYCFIFSLEAIASSPTLRETILEIKPYELTYKLGHTNLIANSEVVVADSMLFQKGKDYLIDYRQGTISFRQGAVLSDYIKISYNIIPDFMLEKFVLYEMSDVSDSLSKLTGKKPLRFLPEDNRLQITGTKTFSLSFSNQESFDLKQSLYIKLQGELSPNLKIEGQLSDSQSPLNPEGDSRELSSIDQVFFKVYGKQYEIALGDLEWEFKDTHLMQYQSRFEGINLWCKKDNAVQAAMAANGGKSNSNIFQGVDGKQGPYYLSANSSSQNVLVVPGSERISINGERLERGTDYSIEYSEGSITFKILITSNSRITVDFQYTDDYYRQSLYLNSSLIRLTDNLRLQHHVIWQRDDKNNPLQWTFSQADKDSLRKAGDGVVWGQGVIETEPGKGLYRLLTDDNGNEYYEYSSDVADTTAIYLIYFSFVGFGNGDYEPFAPSKYIYKGIGQGSYLPLKRLIAPADKANVGLDLAFSNDLFDLSLEGMFSNYDKNTFSQKEDGDNSSLMTYSSASWHPPADKINPRLTLTHRQRLADSYSFSNQTTYDDSYLFSALPAADSLAQNQIDVTGEVNVYDFWKQSLTYIYKRVSSYYTQKALKAQTITRQYRIIPSFDWFAALSGQTYSDSLLTSSQIYNHNLTNQWQYKLLKLRLNHLLQQDKYDYALADSVSIFRGRRYQKYSPALTFGNDKTFNSSFTYTRDRNDSKTTTRWNQTKYSDTWQYSQLFSNLTNTVNLGFTHRIIHQLPSGATSGTFDKSAFDLFDLKSGHQLLDNSVSLNTVYQLNQLEFFPKIRELQYVGDGLGNYDIDTTLVVNGDYDWIYVNSGESRLSTEINANASIFFRLSDKYTRADFWKRLQAESSVNITENTTHKSDFKLYLLLPGEIFNSGTTLYGRQTWQNTVWYDLLRNKIALKMQYENSRTLDNRYQDISQTLSRTAFTELEFKKAWGMQIRTGYTNTLANDSRYNSRVLTQSLDTVFFRNLSSSAYTQLTLSQLLEDGNTQDDSEPYKIITNKVNPSISWFWQQKYRLSSNLAYQYNDRSGSALLSFMPEKRNGSIFTMSFQALYKISSFTSGSIEYSAKSYPKDAILHELKMEFRAEL